MVSSLHYSQIVGSVLERTSDGLMLSIQYIVTVTKPCYEKTHCVIHCKES